MIMMLILIIMSYHYYGCYSYYSDSSMPGGDAENIPSGRGGPFCPACPAGPSIFCVLSEHSPERNAGLSLIKPTKGTSKRVD